MCVCVTNEESGKGEGRRGGEEEEGLTSGFSRREDDRRRKWAVPLGRARGDGFRNREGGETVTGE